MAVINVLKDGTIVDDMSKVKVPKHIVEAVIRISERKEIEEGTVKKKCS